MTDFILTNVGYTRQLACNFWLDFDRPFNGAFRKLDDKMVNLIQLSGMILSLYQQNYDIGTKNLVETTFKNDIENLNKQQEIGDLANAQFDVINNHFKDEKGNLNLNNLKRAIEDFGQGVLYDPNHDNERTAIDEFGNPRFDIATGNKMILRVHKMDSDGQWTWWHSFIRAAGLTFPNELKYFELDKLIAYSCMINSIVKPKQSYEFPNGEIPEDSVQNPNGPGSPEALDKAKFILDLKESKELDKMIETYGV